MKWPQNASWSDSISILIFKMYMRFHSAVSLDTHSFARMGHIVVFISIYFRFTHEDPIIKLLEKRPNKYQWMCDTKRGIIALKYAHKYVLCVCLRWIYGIYEYSTYSYVNTSVRKQSNALFSVQDIDTRFIIITLVHFSIHLYICRCRNMHSSCGEIDLLCHEWIPSLSRFIHTNENTRAHLHEYGHAQMDIGISIRCAAAERIR